MLTLALSVPSLYMVAICFGAAAMTACLAAARSPIPAINAARDAAAAPRFD